MNYPHITEDQIETAVPGLYETGHWVGTLALIVRIDDKAVLPEGVERAYFRADGKRASLSKDASYNS